MITLKEFRKRCIAVNVDDTELLNDLAKSSKIEFFFEGWNVKEHGYEEVFFYPLDQQTVLIMRREFEGKNEFVYSWMHPNDEYCHSLHAAENAAFNEFVNFDQQHDCDEAI